MLEKATAVKDVIQIAALHAIEGSSIIETSCNDFDEYKALPNVIQYNAVIYCKTGWSSDSGYACYKSNMFFAKAIK